MRGKARRQSRLIHCISAPIRVLREFYTKKLFDCAGWAGSRSAVCPTPLAAQLPANSGNRTPSGNQATINDLRAPLKVMSKRGMGVTVDREGKGDVLVGGASGVGMRSYSFGIGRTRRINEDKPCEFEEEDVMTNSCDSMYARARVFWCRRRNLVGISRPKLVRLGKVTGMGESREG